MSGPTESNQCCDLQHSILIIETPKKPSLKTKANNRHNPWPLCTNKWYCVWDLLHVELLQQSGLTSALNLHECLESWNPWHNHAEGRDLKAKSSTIFWLEEKLFSNSISWAHFPALSISERFHILEFQQIQWSKPVQGKSNISPPRISSLQWWFCKLINYSK